MKQTVLLYFLLCCSFIINAQTSSSPYVLQSSDVTISTFEYISASSITNFNTSMYDYGNIEIPAQIDGETIVGIDGSPTWGGALENKGITNLTLPGSIAEFGVKAFANNALTSLTIAEGTDRILAGAFSNNELTSVTLPSTLTIIYNYAFDGNINLTSIILPICSKAGFSGWLDANGQTYAGGDAITDFTLTYTAQFVSQYTLVDADVTIINGIITACSNSLVGATINIPDTLQGQEVIGIDANVFSSLNIEDVILPTPKNSLFINWLSGTSISYDGGEHVTDYTTSYTAQFVASYTLTDTDITINNGVISACTNVDDAAIIIVPDTLQGQEVIGIDANVFSAYSSITGIVLPTPEASGFSNWLSETGASYAGGVNVTDLTVSYTAQIITNYTLTDADITISNGVISACTNVDDATIIIVPDTLQGQEVIGIDANVFSAYSSSAEIVLPTPEASDFISWLSGTGVSYAGGDSITDLSTSYIATYTNDWYTLTHDDASVDNSGALQSVSYNFAVTNIIIPDTLDGYAVKEIAYNVFENKDLTKIKLPSTLEVLWPYAFDHNKIESIEISDSTYIDMGYACFNDNLITEINGIPSDGFIYAKNTDGTNDSTTIVSYGGGKTILDFIPSTATTIAHYAFIEAGLTEVTIPNTISKIEAAAFNLNEISKINGATTDGIIFNRNANGSVDSTTIVSYCGTATNIDFIPYVVTKIGTEAFWASDLTNVEIHENIDTIEYGGFYANDITNVSFAQNGNLKYIGEQAFYYNTGLSITLPTSNITTFGGWIDRGNNLYQAGKTIPNSSLSTFYAAYLPYTLTDADVVMQEGNIISCSNTNGATAITIPDTLDGQSVIGLRAGVLQDKGVVVACLPSLTNLTGFNGWLDFDNNSVSLTNSLYTINDFDITYIANMPTYTLTSMDVVMNGTELQSCSFSFGITNIIIPETLNGQNVESLGEYSFREKGITAITLPSTLEIIGESSLTRNGFSSIVIPSNVTVIDKYAFYGAWIDINTNVSNVVFEVGSKLTTIGTSAFGWCTGITQIDFPSTIEEIGDNAFNGCSLTSITIPSNTKSIGYRAFCEQGTYSNSLTSITIEDNSKLEVIGEGAFASNENFYTTGFRLPTSAINNFMYWSCSGPGSTGQNYTGGESTAVLTGEYRAQYPYTLTNGDVVVTDNYIQTCDVYNNILSVYIIIPETLDGQTVIGIADNYVFGPFTQHGFEGVELPNTLEYIADYAFWSTNLSEITIPQNVVYIGEQAFKGTSISEITLPDCTTTGFAGWITSNGNYVSSTDSGYVVTDFGISYTATYEVLFYDYDGTLLKTNIAKHYASAVPPADPSRTGFTFTGWDTDYSYITQGLSVSAQYDLINSIEENEESMIQIYPNPTQGSITVNLNDNYTNATNIQVLDLNGKSMLTQEVNSAITALDLSVLKKGFYIIRVQTTEQTFSEKVLLD